MTDANPGFYCSKPICNHACDNCKRNLDLNEHKQGELWTMEPDVEALYEDVVCYDYLAEE
jgi:hypothetical protein